MTCLPDRLMVRSSSSSASTPSRVKPPSRASAGGSSTSVDSMRVAHVREIVELGQRAIERAAPADRPGRVRRRGTTRERLLQTDEIARTGGAERGAGHQPLEVLDGFDRVAELAALGRPERQFLDRVEPIADRLERHQRTEQPRAEQPAAHRRHRCGRVRRAATRRVRPPSPRRSRGASASSDRSSRRVGPLPIGDGPDVREVDLLRAAQVVHERAGGRHGGGASVETEAFEAADPQLVEQRAPRRLELERPGVDGRDGQIRIGEARPAPRLPLRAGASIRSSARPSAAGTMSLARRSTASSSASACMPSAPAYSAALNSPVERSSSATPSGLRARVVAAERGDRHQERRLARVEVGARRSACRARRRGRPRA